MPDKLVHITQNGNAVVEISFTNESLNDHRADKLNAEGDVYTEYAKLHVQSKFNLRCLEKAVSSDNSIWYERWSKEFGPFFSPGLRFWRDYSPTIILKDKAFVGVESSLYCLDLSTGDILFSKLYSDTWIRSLGIATNQNSIYVLYDIPIIMTNHGGQNFLNITLDGEFIWKTGLKGDPILQVDEVTASCLKISTLSFKLDIETKTGKILVQAQR